jgi:hypothetical protein
MAGGFVLAAWLLLIWFVHSTLLAVVVLPLLIAGLRTAFVLHQNRRARDPQ